MEHDLEHFFARATHFFGGRHPRHHGGRGFGRFGGGFMDDGDVGGRGMRMGRKLSSEDLQLLVLSLIEEKPRHGYEIIKMLEERSKGFYTPSPGMVYPALTYLEEIGHAVVETEGTRKLYRITEDGAAYLAEHRAAAEAMLQQFERAGEKMERMRRAFAGEAASEDDDLAGRHGRDSREMHEARGRLKAALHEAHGASPEERKRIAAILLRAADEILRKPS